MTSESGTGPPAGTAAGDISLSDLKHFETAGRLTIDLKALKENWRDLKAMSPHAETAAVVKANAYGLGLGNVVPALWEAGCRVFFVAILAEARRVRAIAPEAKIYVLDGLAPDAHHTYHLHNVRPVLGSLTEIETWSAHCRETGEKRAAAIHIDTGMNRLGLTAEEVEVLAGRPELFEHFRLSLVMSHLACADTPNHSLNAYQVALFDELRDKLPVAPASLANSAGTILGGPYTHDLVRPGVAIYGGRAVAGRPNPMRPVVRVEARVLRTRLAEAGTTVGYGAAQRLKRDTRMAILSVGYADGYFRAAGSTDAKPGGVVYFADHPAPIIGRVSMDLIAVDVTDVPNRYVNTGGYAELLGERFTVDDLADRAGTIGYEVLTSLGQRFHRICKDG
ncbi:alanine racemase [Microbaculum marinum]|uniref:Alanine racemase n=1 Tax=Microbaculum marinum TaxID=1764581 RepID=A0AAW9RT36_9HYPH